MEFKEGIIVSSPGSIFQATPLKAYADARGMLVELFRRDELSDETMPVMAYMSATHPGIVRGPHEHNMQSDYFCFVGPSDFKLVLWDNRPKADTYMTRMELVLGESNPMLVIVPPHVVHAYKNIGPTIGYVFNAANTLYKGWNRGHPVDEIRHEIIPDSPFKLA